MLKRSSTRGLRGHLRMAGRKRPVRRLIGIGLAVLTVGGVLSVNVPTVGATAAAYYHQYQITRPAYEAKYGLWTKLNIPAEFRVNGIHSTLLNNGDVLIMAGSGNNQSYFDAGTFKTLLLDPVTNLIVAQRYDADRGATRVEEQFSDYRSVNGLQVAFSAVVQIDGLPAATRRVRTFEYNVPLAADLFNWPG